MIPSFTLLALHFTLLHLPSNSSLTSVETYFYDLHLRLNFKKTKCMLFNRKRSVTCPYKITSTDGSELKFVNNNSDIIV